MKKLLLILLVLTNVSISQAQKYKHVPFDGKDTTAFIVAHTNYCLNKHANEKLIAIAAEIVGAGLIAYSKFRIIQWGQGFRRSLNTLLLVMTPKNV